MTPLISKQPKRLFTFGCSFTKWKWPTWPNIISYDLSIPLYNYGEGGAGNQYIFNALMQADITYNINENDLVMISWTNLCREDRYRNNEWHFPGNMYTQDLYDQKYVKHWASPEWYSRRDFAVIKAAWDILNNKGCQFHFIKMVDFKKFNQWSEEDCQNMNDVINFYNFYLSKIEKSFVDVLWGGDFSARAIKDSLIRKNFNDGHPDISEHLLYLEKTFDYSFSSKTINIVNEKNNELIALIKKNDNDFSSLFFNESEKIFKI